MSSCYSVHVHNTGTNKQTKLINRISVNNYERQTLYKAGECMI